MNLRRIPLLSVPLLLACAAAAARAQAPGAGAADDAARARILRAAQAKLDEARAALKLPGATVGFALPGGLSASASTGLADVEAKTPLRPTDRMPAGSVGKTFVAALALKLAEEGRLDLDEKVSRRLGGEGHDGEFPGYLSDVRYFPKYGLAVAVQVNADESEAASRFASTAVEDFARLVVRELSGRSLDAGERESARAAAEAWLRLVDAGRFAESSESLSSELKARYPTAKWEAVMRPFSSKFGKLKTRRFRGADYADPEAGTVAVDFASPFAEAEAASETVTLKREAGGWRVAGYTIR